MALSMPCRKWCEQFDNYMPLQGKWGHPWNALSLPLGDWGFSSKLSSVIEEWSYSWVSGLPVFPSIPGTGQYGYSRIWYFLSMMAPSELPNVWRRQLQLSRGMAPRHSMQAGTFELHYFASDSDLGEYNYPGHCYPHRASVSPSAPAAWTHFGSRLDWGTKESSGLPGPHREESTLGYGSIRTFNYLL